MSKARCFRTMADHRIGLAQPRSLRATVTKAVSLGAVRITILQATATARKSLVKSSAQELMIAFFLRGLSSRSRKAGWRLKELGLLPLVRNGELSEGGCLSMRYGDQPKPTERCLEDESKWNILFFSYSFFSLENSTCFDRALHAAVCRFHSPNLNSNPT